MTSIFFTFSVYISPGICKTSSVHLLSDISPSLDYDKLKQVVIIELIILSRIKQ